MGQYEIDEGVAGSKERLYLCGDAYSAPAVYIKQNGSWSLHYISRDYLGSITHITNSNGSVVQELSYDAWGRLRNPANRQAYAPGEEPELFLGRGYTGHEHLTQFGLINMNARLYDPAVGRFLSADPYVQMPDFSQSFNRYSYALNNPLKYTDPSGENPFAIAGLFLLGKLYYDGYKANNGEFNPTKWNWQNASFAFGYSSQGSNFFGGIGWNNNFSMGLGYSLNQGFGIGYSSDGYTNLYYPSYNYNAPEQSAAKAFDNTVAVGSEMTYAAALGIAMIELAPEWTIALGEPTPIGEIVVGAATIGTAIYIVHANSKKSLKPNIVYEIYSYNSLLGYQTMKYGISSREDFVRRSGNPRPEYQVLSLNITRPHGFETWFGYTILERTPDRATALQREKDYVNEYYRRYGKIPQMQKRPIPEIWN
jgi:RHS repeat-associated protein